MKKLITEKNAHKIFASDDTRKFMQGKDVSFCTSSTFTLSDPERTYLSNVTTTNGGKSWIGTLSENNTKLNQYLYDYDNNVTCSADMVPVDSHEAERYILSTEISPHRTTTYTK